MLAQMRLIDWFETQQGLTQKAFADRVGVTQGRIGHLLRGDQPSMKLAARILKATGGKVTPNDFLSSPSRKKAA